MPHLAIDAIGANTAAHLTSSAHVAALLSDQHPPLSRNSTDALVLSARERLCGTVSDMKKFVRLFVAGIVLAALSVTAGSTAPAPTTPQTRAALLADILNQPDAALLALTLLDNDTASTHRPDATPDDADGPYVATSPLNTDPTAPDTETETATESGPAASFEFDLSSSEPAATDDSIVTETLPATSTPPAEGLAELLPENRLGLLATATIQACPIRGYTFRDTWGAPRSGGRTHKGTDIAAPVGAPIRAVAAGEIVRTSPDDKPGSLGGITVSILHPNGDSTYYAHLADIVDGIEPGVTVHRDQIIGFNGQTGNAVFSVPHLHFGLYSGSEAVNPTGALFAVCADTETEPLN